MMDRMLYVASSGTERIMKAQTVQMNNLANINTNGFRAEIAEASAHAASARPDETRVFVDINESKFSFEQGDIQTTGNDLDVAVMNDGWIGVQNKAGEPAMTRSGSLKISPDGMLETKAGDPVLGSGGPITIPAFEKMDIATDGTISIIPQGQGANSLVQLDRIRLVKPEHDVIQRAPDGLFYTNDNSPLTADPDVRVTPGAVEGSNVNSLTAMANVLDLSRQYEMQVKLMRLAEDNADASAQIMQID